MKKKKLIAIISSAVAVVIVASVILIVALAGKGGKKDAIWIMTEEMSGLFNPYYATAGADHDVIGMTQIGMLSTDSTGKTTAGDAEPTVVKAFTYEKNAEGNTVYKFVIKNGLKFSDGYPLTMNDVMFNIYEYLDPVYTGSSTMYSTKIIGLTDYRTQTKNAGTAGEEALSGASKLAYTRRLELERLYKSKAKKGDNSYDATPAQMAEYISNHTVSSGYRKAIGQDVNPNVQLQADYDLACDTFRKEIENDYKAAKEAFDLTSDLYKPHADKLKNDVFKFFLLEGYITPKYAIGDDKKEDKNKIDKFENENYAETYNTMEKAINYVVDNKIQYNFNEVITAWGTASTLLTRFEADARSSILKDKIGKGMTVPNIEGIVSLGHSTGTETEVNVAAGEGKTVGGDLGTYKIATKHNPDGTPANAGEYDVLQITVEGTDPKAIYNFGFTVAPQHYYATNDKGVTETVDIENNKFGLKFADSDFQTNVIQSQRHVSIPVGAGPFVATDEDNNDNPAIDAFNKGNTVYYKANKNFMFPVKAEKLRLFVVSSSNAIDKLEKGEVDYISPQLTKDNYSRLQTMKKTKGIEVLDSWQLGYGYIGINAGKVPNVYIRRAIMAAMNTKLVTDFYQEDAVDNIQWPMSKMSWAYPYREDGKTEIDPNKSWTKWEDAGKDTTKAVNKIKALMSQAGVSEGSKELEITFTIAGTSVGEHPTYQVFKNAQDILNKLGWKIEVRPDSQALTKLATGSLAVWAAAWGSTIDPDMYQVYHKNSTATSVFAWGYREIKADTATYSYEMGVINKLSDIIDYARSIDDTDDRKAQYQEAMKLVLDLAVEMPVYQRKNLYAYNAKSVKGFNNNVNPYSSPLEKIWELELVK